MADYGQEEEGKKLSKKDAEKILKQAREQLKLCVEEESTERAKMLDDLKFCTLDQWPHEIRKDREDVNQEGGARPCLTIDKTNQYIAQTVNDLRQGKPGINVRPQDDDADVETAKYVKGLIRNIEDQSKADIAYSTAAENAVKIGLGYVRVATEYVAEDSFDQEIFIRAIPNTFSVYLGKHIIPDGSDAEHAFIAEQVPVEKFKELYPKAKVTSEDFEDLDDVEMSYWRGEDTVTVAEYYCFDSVQDRLLYLEDGTTMSGRDYAAWPEETAGPKPRMMRERDTVRRQLKWYKMTAVEILDSRDLPGKFIPIAEEVGRESWVEGKRILWGLVRPAKDSLRMYNYWASTITERMALEPRQPYIGAKGQFEGLEHIWAKANRINRPYLEYNTVDVNGTPIPPPQRVGPHPIEAALLKQMEVIEHDVQTAVGIFKAGVGESESQQSGRAILALQRESDTGTYHFGANQAVTIRHVGRIVLDLIPHYYDTRRIVRIMGEDGEVQSATLDPNHQGPAINGVFNPGLGKYDISITVGPSYNTKRMEAAATFVELAKGAADPISAAILRYLTVRNSDFSGADEATKMLRAVIPAPVLQAVSGNQSMPPQAQAIVAQYQQQIQQLQQELQQEQAGTKVQALKVAGERDVKLRQLQQDGQAAAEQAKQERAKATAAHDLAVWQAEEKAKLEHYVAEQKARLAESEARFEAQLKERQAKAEQEQRQFENAMAIREQQQKDEATAMPNFQKALTDLTQAFTKALDVQAQTMEKLIVAIKEKEPSQIVLGNIQRGPQGITGATATIQ